MAFALTLTSNYVFSAGASCCFQNWVFCKKKWPLIQPELSVRLRRLDLDLVLSLAEAEPRLSLCLGLCLLRLIKSEATKYMPNAKAKPGSLAYV